MRHASAEVTSLERKASAALEKIRAHEAKLTPSKTALVAVSGGRDSVALLDYLVRTGWSRLVVVHLNHQLRGRASDADEKFVRELSERLSVPVEVHSEDVKRRAKEGRESIETAAREARREFFRAVARRHRCGYLFTAHHAGDQAETVLHRLCRGASLAGAGGMALLAGPMRGLKVIRPLLEVTRREIDEYVAARGLKFREDESNADSAHTRNRVRHELLPLMDDVFRRDVSGLLCRFAVQSARDDDALQRIADEFVRRRKAIAGDGALVGLAALRREHEAVQSRVIHRWLGGLGVCDLSSREVEAAMRMLRGEGPAKVNLPGDAHLCRDGQRLWVEASPSRRQPRSSRPSRKTC